MEENKVENVINIIKDMDIRTCSIDKIKDLNGYPRTLLQTK